MNCQLARTNINLGGQMQWDLIVGNTNLTDDKDKGNDLAIKDFHLTPISEYIPYNYQKEEDLLNHTHLENIKNFYNKIPNNFFENSINTKFKTNYPIIKNNDLPLKTIEDSYIAGIKRIKFQRYKKQFACFCPIWMESINDLKNLCFNLNIFNYEKRKDIEGNEYEYKRTIIKRKISFKYLDNEKYHNKFIKYFNEYINKINPTEDLFSIKYTTNESWIKGVNVKYGIPETKDTTYVLDNMTNRERPLLEFDNFMIQQFASNNLIAGQLFNFNFIFNSEDILPGVSTRDYFGQEYQIEMYCEIENKNSDSIRLPFKDFFCNYENINKLIIPEINYKLTDEKLKEVQENCFNYLKDNRCINFITKNKMAQQTCHWSLLDNDNYIFQLYDGFAPIFINEQGIIRSTHRYFDMPDIWNATYYLSKNNINWCGINQDVLTSESDILNIRDIYKNNLTTFKLEKNKKVVWANSLKYDISNIDFDKYKNIIYKKNKDIIKFNIGIFYTNSEYKDIEPQLNAGKYFKYTEYIYFNIDTDLQTICFLIIDTKSNKGIAAEKLNDLTFKKMQQEFHLLNLKNIQQGNEKWFDKENKNIQIKTYELFNLLNELFVNIIKPSFIFFKKGINPIKVHLPKTKSKFELSNQNYEIEYLKIQNMFNYVIRYDGKLRPCFIDIKKNKFNYFNYQYYYMTDDNEKYNEFNKLTLSKFTPLYPSMNYFAIQKQEMNEDIYKKPIPIFYNQKDLSKVFEYKWYQDSRIRFCYENIVFKIIEHKNLNIQSIDELKLEIKKRLKSYYLTENDDLVDYIYNLYNIKYDFEYKNKTDINDYIYIVKMTLK